MLKIFIKDSKILVTDYRCLLMTLVDTNRNVSVSIFDRI